MKDKLLQKISEEIDAYERINKRSPSSITVGIVAFHRLKAMAQIDTGIDGDFYLFGLPVKCRNNNMKRIILN